MKKTLLSIGIGFYDLNVKTDYTNKNHSFASLIEQSIGGSMINIARYVDDSGVLFKCGNDIHGQCIIDTLHQQNIVTYPIFVNYPQPIFVIVNQKERYTTLNDYFEIDDNTVIDLSICSGYQFGITNSKSTKFINRLLTTDCRWIINSYINDNVDYSKLEGLILNREEASLYHSNPRDVLIYLDDKGLKWAIITLDKEGCLVLDNHNIYQIFPHNTTLQSKIRTGDYFTATLIKQLAKGTLLLDSVKIAMFEVEQFLKTYE